MVSSEKAVKFLVQVRDHAPPAAERLLSSAHFEGELDRFVVFANILVFDVTLGSPTLWTATFL